MSARARVATLLVCCSLSLIGAPEAEAAGACAVTTPIGSANEEGLGLAIQPDGKIVVVGYSTGANEDFALVRYKPDLTLDTPFGTGGKVVTPIGSSNDRARAVAIQPDGKIVVVGYAFTGANNDIALARYNANGSLDLSFDGNGKKTVDLGLSNDELFDVAIQPDGKIVVVGRTQSSNYDFLVARFTATGQLDSAFAGSGFTTFSVDAFDEAANAVALQTDGKIVVAGTDFDPADNDVVVARFNPNGSFDTSFAGVGYVTGSPAPNDRAKDVAIQSDGKIVIVGDSVVATDRDVTVMRLNYDGTPDSSFNLVGYVRTDLGSANDVGEALALQEDGRILAAGTGGGAGNDMWVLRYDGTGTLDSSFDTDGKASVGLVGTTAAYAAGIGASGSVYVAGSTIGAMSAYDFAIGRLRSDGSSPCGEIYLHPIGQGSTSTFVVQSGCLATERFKCVNDQAGEAATGIPATNDGIATHLQDNAANREMFALVDGSISAGAVVVRIEIGAQVGKQGGPTQNLQLSYQRVGFEPIQDGPPAPAPSNCCPDFASWIVSGIGWSATELDALEVGLVRIDGSGALRVSQLYAKVTYMLSPPTVNYRSIGTAPDYTGTVNVTTGSELVTGNGGAAWKTANRGRGDRVDIAGVPYTIFAVTSENQLTLTTPYTGSSNPAAPYTISRQYATLAAWEDCIDGPPGGACSFFPVSGTLVADNRSEVGIVYKDGSPYAGGLVMDGSVTDATHTITLTVAQENRHYGIPGTGVVIDNGVSASPAIQVLDNYVTLERFEIQNGSGGGAWGIHVNNVDPGGANRTVLRNNLIHDIPASWGIVLSDMDHVADVYNNIVYSTDIGIRIANNLQPWTQIRLVNNTLYSNTTYGVNSSATINPDKLTLRNNLAASNGNDYAVNGTTNGASSHNLSTDPSAALATVSPGGFALANQNIDTAVKFVNKTAFDLHVQTDSVAKNAGAPVAFFGSDIDDGLRGSQWDIGADEFGAQDANLTLANHNTGQTADRFTTTTPVTDVLYAFKLTRSGNVTVDTLRVNFTTGGGVANGDVTAGELWVDVNNDRVINGGDTSIQTGVTPVGGVLTFTIDFTPSTTGTNYVVRVTVDNLVGGDTTTFSVGTADIDEVEAGVVESGSITNAVHTQNPTTLTLANHSAGQVGDRFTTTTPVTNVLYAFNLTRSGNVTVDTLRVNFTTAGGVVDGDVTAGELWIDADNDRVIDGGETPIQTGITPVGGVLTFTNDFTPSTAGTNYLVRVTVSNLVPNDTTTFSLGTAGIDEVEAGVVESGSITNAVHTQNPATLTLANHSAGQTADKFSITTPVTDVLFALKLTRSLTVTVTNLRVNFSTGGGVVNGDVTGGELWVDNDNNGVINAGDTSIEIGVTPVGGVLTFTNDFTPSTAGTNYLVRATVSNLLPSDATTFSMGAADIDEVEAGVLESGSITTAIHAGVGAPIAHQETRTGTGSGTSVTTSAALTNVLLHLYMAAVTVNPNVNVATVSGMGLTWTKLKQQCGSQDKVGIALFYAIGNGGSNGTVTANFSSSSTNAVIAVSRYSGVNTSSPVGTAFGENASGGGGTTCGLGSQNPNAYESLTTLQANSWAYAAVGNRQTYEFGVSNLLGHTQRANLTTGGANSNEASLVVVDQLRAASGTYDTGVQMAGDTKWGIIVVEIKAGTVAALALADHDTGQTNDKFTTTTPVTDVLYAFKLTRFSAVTVTNLRVNFTTVGGVANGDVTAGELWVDNNGDGVIDGGDTAIQTGVTPAGGVLTFANNFSPSTTGTNYLVRATVSNLLPSDTTTFSVGAADIDEMEAGVEESGSITSAVHTQDGDLALSNHDAGQTADKFINTTPVTDVLYAFKLTRSVTVTVDTLGVNFSTGGGVASADVTSGELWTDVNNDGIINAGDTSIQIGVTPVGGVLTFTNDFSPSTTGTNYLVRATVANLVANDTTTFSVAAADIAEVEAGIAESGSITNAVHTQDDIRDVPFFTATAKYESVKLEWVAPSGSPCQSVLILRRDDGAPPTGPTDPSAFSVPAPNECDPGEKYYAEDGTVSNDTTYDYAAFVHYGGAIYSPGEFLKARPMDTTSSNVRWAYSTGATSMSAPGLRFFSGASFVYAVSNDSILHSMNGGGVGGDWPANWTPYQLGGPAQNRPPVVPFPVGSSMQGVVFLGSQNGSVYAIDANDGSKEWEQPIATMVQAAPAGYFPFPPATAPFFVFAGTRNGFGIPNSFKALDLESGTEAWSFENSSGLPQQGDDTDIGVINGSAAVDYQNKRVFFASNVGTSGNPSDHTLWCVDFSTGAPQLLWKVDLGDIDGSPVLGGDKVYVGSEDGWVHAVDRNSGLLKWSFDTGDGAIKNFVFPQFGTNRVLFSTDNKVWAVQDNGDDYDPLWWEITTISSPSTPTFVPGTGKILVGSGDGNLYQVDAASYTVMSQAQLGDGSAAVGVPTVNIVHSMIYVGTDEGVIYGVAFPLP